MLFLSIISVLILLAIAFYFARKADILTTSAFILKIMAGISLGLVYKYYYQGGDTWLYFQEARAISNFLSSYPGSIFDVYFNTLQVADLPEFLVFGSQPRALFFAKIVSVFYLVSGGNYWVLGAYLSAINFFAVYFLIKEISSRFPGMKKAAIYSFFFLPTFIFWTSGLLKESLAIAALAFATGIVIRIGRTRNFQNIGLWILLAFSLILFWKLKYFYAAVTIPILGALLMYEIPYKIPVVKYFLMLFALVGSLLIVSNLHYNLGFQHVLNVIYQNYLLGIEDGNAVKFHSFDGSTFGFVINMPLALLSGLFRPAIFEINNTLQGVVAIENLVILMLLVVGLWKVKFKISTKNIYFIALIVFIVSLAVLITYSSPNFGTLSRYKVAYWPFFVMLVLGLFFHKKRSGSEKPDLP